MDIYYAISVLLLVLDFAKAQPDPWICNFQFNECEISQSSADHTFWFLVPANDGNAYYRAAINVVGDKYYGFGTFATFILPPASYPSSGRGVLSFMFLSYTTNPSPQHGYLTVTTCKGENPVLTLGNHGNNWYFREIEFTCGSNPVKIFFTAVRGSSYTHIEVDIIKVTEIITTATEAVASATSLVTRVQTLTPSISPSLTSSSIPTYTDSTARYNMSTDSILENTGKGSIRSNRVILLVVSSICIVLFICLIVTGYVFWRKRYRPTDIEDKGSDDNGDKLYTNPVYSSHDNAHSQPDILVGTPTGHLSQETQQAQESIDEYEEFEGGSNPQLYSMPLRKQDRSERTGDNQTDIKDKNLPGQAVLYDDEEYNALDFNRDKFPKTNKIFTTSQTYKPSLPENSSETITDDASDYGVLECPGAVGDDDYKSPRYENFEPGVPSEAEQMEGPGYYSLQDSLPVRPEDESSIEHACSAADAPREGDFEPIYSDEVYGEF